MTDTSSSLSLLQSTLRAASLRATIIAFFSAAVVVGSLGYATVSLRKDEQTIVKLKGTIKELQQAGTENTTTGQDKINALQGLLQQAQNEIVSLKAAGAGTQGQNTTLTNELNDAQGKITALTNELGDAQGRITTLTNELGDANNKIQQLQTALNQDNQRIQQLQNTPAPVCPSNDQLILQLRRAEQTLQALERICPKHVPPPINPG
jgi:chromosome segregation ATPase